MTKPKDHPLRRELNDEVHARPPEALMAPLRISYLALLSERGVETDVALPVTELAQRYGVPGPSPKANHFSVDLGAFRIKWERHTEFTRYKFIIPGTGSAPGPDTGKDLFRETAISVVPADWLSTLPGTVIAATHVVMFKGGAAEMTPDGNLARHFGGNTLLGAALGEGAAMALTDFRIHEDGFSRLLFADRSMSPRQAGRTVQRLLEIDTYRMMALLALPVARELSPFLTRCEKELAEITAAMVGAQSTDEGLLLDRLTRLEAEIENRHSVNSFRFSAAVAYYDLVRRRIDELREQRIEGTQTFREFTERRLAPAMGTCHAVSERQTALSQRVAQATQLLSTRVDISTERQNQAVLESMNTRAKMQLRLQETVEGLSIAAVTYYVVGLVGYALKAMKAGGYNLNPDLWTGISVPLVVLFVALGLRQVRRFLVPASLRGAGD